MTRKSNQQSKQKLITSFNKELFSFRYKRRLPIHETPIPMFQDVLNKLLLEKEVKQSELSK